MEEAVGELESATKESGSLPPRVTGRSDGKIFVTTSGGTTYDIPASWVEHEAENGKGIVYHEPGATGNANSIRIMEPTAQYPKGYVRYYHKHGQPWTSTGSLAPPARRRFQATTRAPIPGWPSP